VSLRINDADRAFVRQMIREMRAAIQANPEAPTVTTGPLDPDVLEHVLAVAMQNSAQHAAPAEARGDQPEGGL
jgi:hypothetical protein